MPFCLTKAKSTEFIQKLKNGELNIDELSQMTSEARRAAFAFLGEEHAREVNALFESKLLLKYQKRGFKNWIEQTAGLKETAKRDLLSRVQRMEKILSPEEEQMFLEDLAAKKLGVDITEDEARTIYELSQDAETKKALIPEDSPIRSKERIEYGVAYTKFQDYVMDLKREANKKSIKDYIKRPQELLYDAGGITKSILASLDNSFFGRQGLKMMFSHPAIWTKNFVKSFGDITKTIAGNDAMLAIKSDIYSRPNAINDKYKTMKLDIGLTSEEAFPSSLPERIPLFGRLFKASEVAYNGAAMRMRADYADRLIELAESQGINTKSKDEMIGIGRLINSTTGRGSIGKAEPLGKEINALFFSIKFLKSNIDTLTAHIFDPKATPFARKQAAMNLTKIIAGIAGVLAISEQLWPGSVETDPRSSDFGKIKINKTRFDITGGMGSLLVLASRLTPTLHNGEWGFWSQSSTSGKFTNLTEGKYGQATALDVFENFWEGKLAPLAGIVRDVWKGKDFSGKKPTLESVGKNLITPLPVQTFEKLSQEKGSAPTVAAMILDALGFSTQTY